MKIFLLFAGFLVLVAADISEKLAEKSVDKASDKSSDSKPKRDASFLLGSSYHGPSYKYLPPSQIASVYDSYASGGHSGSFAGSGSSGLGHSSSSGHRHHGHGYSHHSGLGGGVKFVGASHGFGGSSSYPGGYAGSSSSSSGSGSHGYTAGGLGGHVSGHGYAGGRGGYSGSSSGHSYVLGHGASSSSAGHASFGSGHGFSSSGLGHKVVTSSAAVPSYSLSAGHVGSGAGSAAGLGGGYHYSKGISGSLPSVVSVSSGSHGYSGQGHAGQGYSGQGYSGHGFSGQGFSGQGFSGQGFSGQGFSGHEVHDHVHNGNQEHHYVVSSSQDSGVGAGVGAGDQGYHYEAPNAQYLPPAVPSSSYGVPLDSIGASYSPKYPGGSAADEAPAYAAGHKGLGHFGFTANKPNVLHTTFVDSGFKTPSYTQVPFKPSTFLGTKFEGSAVGGGETHNPSQQYLPPSGVGADSNGYDYPVPSGGGLQYTENNYQGSNEGSLGGQQPEATYLPPHDIQSSPSGNYLPPTGNSYGH